MSIRRSLTVVAQRLAVDELIERVGERGHVIAGVTPEVARVGEPNAEAQYALWLARRKMSSPDRASIARTPSSAPVRRRPTERSETKLHAESGRVGGTGSGGWLEG